jgi:DNA (cytosine-5)-methyltransferase 1
MIYGSVCSGIEAASQAWHPLGWKPAFFSEIEPFPRAVLKHWWPGVLCHGDFTTIEAGDFEPIDLLVGGTPCQAFSVAGLRGGIHDGRGNLALEFLRLVDRLRPRWVVWENVPGVLSSTSHLAPDALPPDVDLDAGGGPPDGEEVVVEDDYDADESHAFGCFLAGLSELGYEWSFRVLDAQFFGLAQRRARVFVVGYLGDWRPPAAVLFERDGLSGHPPPSRKARERAARPIASGSPSSGGVRNDADTADNMIAFGGNNTAGEIEVATAVNAHGGPHGRQDFESETFIATTLRGRDSARGVDSDATDTLIPTVVGALTSAHGPRGHDGSGLATDKGAEAGHIIAHAFKASHYTRDKDGAPSEVAPPLSADADKGDQDTLIAFTVKDYGGDASGDLSPTLRSGSANGANANGGVMPAIAFALRGREDGAVPEIRGDATSALRAASGGSSRDYIAFDTTQVTNPDNRSNPQPGDPVHGLAAGAHPPAIIEVETLQPDGRVGDASAQEADTDQTLRALRDAVGEEAFAEWRSRISDSLRSPEVLRAAMHGRGVRRAAREAGLWLDDGALPREKSVPAGTLRALWKDGPDGRSPRGLRLAQLLAAEPSAAMPQLPHEGAPRIVAGVRRLTPRECERLMGFPDDFTLVPYRGKPAADGPRYKALGNSMAVPCMAWIGRRIAAVDALVRDGRLLEDIKDCERTDEVKQRIERWEGGDQ